MTEFVYVTGKAKFFRHMVPEEFMGKSSWKHTIYLDQKSLDIVRELQVEGIKNRLKKDEDGYYMTFSRPTKMTWKDKKTGEEKSTPFEPPVVRLKSENKLFTGDVGNGSDIETKLEVYSHGTPGGGKAKAARWLATRVDSLVPAAFRNDGGGGDERALKGLEDKETPPTAGGW